MEFYDILEQVVLLLRGRGRVSSRQDHSCRLQTPGGSAMFSHTLGVCDTESCRWL
jgi:hypothetical protein